MAWRGNSILTVLAAGPRTTGQIADATGMAAPNVPSAINTLRKRGLAASASGVHQITDKGRVWLDNGLEVISGPRPGKACSRRGATLRVRAWRALRLRGKVTLDDLLYLVADGDEKAAEYNLKRYLRALVQAGFLVKLRSGWMLPGDRNTGPEAPALNTKTKTVTDPNTGERWNIG